MAQGLALSTCSLATLISGAILILWAFYNIFKSRLANETEIEVIQRQLRGFAILTIGNIVMALSTVLCAGGVLNMSK